VLDARVDSTPAMFFGASHDQRLELVDHTADVIRDPAG
jgi:hypothetical protein